MAKLVSGQGQGVVRRTPCGNSSVEGYGCLCGLGRSLSYTCFLTHIPTSSLLKPLGLAPATLFDSENLCTLFNCCLWNKVFGPLLAQLGALNLLCVMASL